MPRHALRIALIPAVTVIGVQIGPPLAVVTEVFAIPAPSARPRSA